MLRAKSFHSVCVHDSQIICKSLIQYLYKMDHTNAICWTSIETENVLYFWFWIQNSMLRAKCFDSVYLHDSQILFEYLRYFLYKMDHTNTRYWINIETNNLFYFQMLNSTFYVASKMSSFCMCTCFPNNLQLSDSPFVQNGTHKHNILD